MLILPSAAAVPRSYGPITTTLVRRIVSAYLAVLVVSGILLATKSAFWLAVGVGLWFPGAGFLAVGGWWAALTPVVLGFFVVSLVTWFLSGFSSFPPLVWPASAAVAGLVASDAASTSGIWLALALLTCGCAVGLTARWRSRMKIQRQRRRRLEYLPAAIAKATARAVSSPAARTMELDLETLAALRDPIDRGLQEPGDFTGYTTTQQNRTGAIRYQINHYGYALAVAQAHYAPNFHGYLLRAQRGLIEAYLDSHVWGQWASENTWGSLRLNSEPTGPDNIMLTGYFGLQVGLYTAQSGDHRYLEPGGLGFGQYPHSLHGIVKSLISSLRTAPFGLFPGESNWIYPVCTFRGIAALQVYDRIVGSQNFDELSADFRHQMQTELMGPAFDIAAVKSRHTGVDLPFHVPHAALAVYLNSAYPDVAQRYWAIARTELFTGDQLKTITPNSGIRPGRHWRGYGMPIEALYGAAREFGDTPAAEAVKQSMDTLWDPFTEGGVFRYRKTSNIVNAMVTMDRQLHQNFWRETVMGPTPKSTLSGPVLDEVAYPDVLVARAVSSGNDLDLVLYPGGAAGLQTLRLARLQANRSYRLSGATVDQLVASANGRAQVTVLLDGRTAVTLCPA